MNSAPITQAENEQVVFKQSVKDWLAAQKITMKSLSMSIGVSYGTVRNWFSSSSDLPIGEESRKRIERLMRNPDEIAKKEEPVEEVFLLNISPFTANMAMWRSAAGAPNVHFNQNQYASSGADAKTFAAWGTVILNEAIKKELQKHPIDEIKALAHQVRYVGDPISSEEADANEHEVETSEEHERRTQGIPIKLPIYLAQINALYLALAARCAKKHRDDFIADALNEAANTEFGGELEDFLKTETTLKENKKEEFDDCPF